MDQSCLDWIKTLVGVSFGAAITYIVQTLEFKRTRGFQLKDKATENRRAILLKRVEIIETLVTEVFFSLKDILSLGVKFHSGELPPQDISDRLAGLQNKMQYLSAMAEVLANNELKQRTAMFESKFAGFCNATNKMLANKNMSEIGGAYGEIQVPFMEIVKQLDLIRISILSDNYIVEV